jgi:hypothetical protein
MIAKRDESTATAFDQRHQHVETQYNAVEIPGSVTVATNRDVPANYQALEKQAFTFHETRAADAAEIFLDGFNMLLMGLDPLKGYNFGEAAEQRVIMALFIKTLNSLRCFYELATRGYFIQALNLLRTPVEDWMGYWFLRNFPQRHEEFTTSGSEPPEFNVMVQAIESIQNRQRRREGQLALQPDARVRAWLKQLHQYSHLSRVGVRAIMTIDEVSTNYHLGPDEDEGRFRLCVGEALQVVGAHLEALDNFRRLTGRPPIAAFPAYIDRVEAWQRSQTAIIDALERQREPGDQLAKAD